MIKYQDLIDNDHTEHEIERLLLEGFSIEEQWETMMSEMESDGGSAF